MAGRPPRRWVAFRRISQWVFLALFVALTGFLARDIFFETDPLLVFSSSLAARTAGEIGAALLLVLPTLLLGRFFCGWICPLGTVIDGIGALRRAGNGLSDRANRLARKPKFALLAAVFLLAALGFQYAWTLDPITVAGRFLSLFLLPVAGDLSARAFEALSDLPLVGDAVRDLFRALGNGEGWADWFGEGVQWSVAGVFILVTVSALALARLWCRSLCPLGALYALVGRFSSLSRRVDECTNCRACFRRCRTGAIREDSGYEKGECILCMDCVYDCPTGGTRFAFRAPAPRPGKPPDRGITRAQFLALAAAPALAGLLSAGRARAAAPAVPPAPAAPTDLLRPPGSATGDSFLDLCVRCGNCMNVCPTNVIQPVFLGRGFANLWSPFMAFDIGWCEYNCRKCGEACPTGAIPDLPLPQKKAAVIGLAVVDKKKCIPFDTGKSCIVCQEHCPTPQKAIRMVWHKGKLGAVKAPEVDAKICNGCGICQNKCPTDEPAIVVKLVGSQ